ncbi:MAG: hypothetical protein HQL90_12240 [Magnetococcales bacterium]|nr:hypothetical protein [Magnetococcales bacterium]
MSASRGGGVAARGLSGEAGSAVLLMMTVLVSVLAGLLLEGWTARRAAFPLWLEDAKLLATAQEGLQAYFAVAAPQGAVLPCPDGQGDGVGERACSGAVGHIAVGWLPWRTLGLMPLRTAMGGRVGYAVAVGYVQPAGVGGRPVVDWPGVRPGSGEWAAVLFVPREEPRPGEPVVLAALLREAQWAPVRVERLGGGDGLVR